jgi:hypothetical protein
VVDCEIVKSPAKHDGGFLQAAAEVLGIRTYLPLFGVFAVDAVSVATLVIVAGRLGLDESRDRERNEI